MRMRSLLVTLAVVAVCGQVGSEALAGPGPGERCRMLKLSATGARARELLRCHVRAIGFAMQAVPACLAAADAKLARAFARAERQALCRRALAVAQAGSIGFVASLLASAEPTPVPTPSPTPSPSPMFTGCGNGVVEPGEPCDGQTSAPPRAPSRCRPCAVVRSAPASTGRSRRSPTSASCRACPACWARCARRPTPAGEWHTRARHLRGGRRLRSRRLKRCGPAARPCAT